MSDYAAIMPTCVAGSINHCPAKIMQRYHDLIISASLGECLEWVTSQASSPSLQQPPQPESNNVNNARCSGLHWFLCGVLLPGVRVAESYFLHSFTSRQCLHCSRWGWVFSEVKTGHVAVLAGYICVRMSHLSVCRCVCVRFVTYDD